MAVSPRLPGSYSIGTPPGKGPSALYDAFDLPPKDTDRADYTIEQYGNDAGWERLARAEAFSKRHGLPMIAVALAWLYGKPTVTAPIIGANSVAQLDENLRAAAVRLSPAQLAELG